MTYSIFSSGWIHWDLTSSGVRNICIINTRTSFLNRQSQVPDCHGDSFTASPQVLGMGFTRLLLAEGGKAGGAFCRSQTRKLRHGFLLYLLLHRAAHTYVLSIKQTAPALQTVPPMTGQHRNKR